MRDMKVILHDLTKEQWEAKEMDRFVGENRVLVNAVEIQRYCMGCFCCWLKTPGTCVIKDKFQHMGELLSTADELIIITKATFGSYSSCVKNVLDRSISYVQPFFGIRNGEMHHRERYENQLNISAVFYGDLTEGEKETSRQLVMANAINLNSNIGFVRFETWETLGKGDLA